MKTCRTKRKVKTQKGLISFITVFACFIGLANGSHAEDLSAFSDKFICNMATIKTGEKISWNIDPTFEGYLLEASRREIKCLVEDREEKNSKDLLAASFKRQTLDERKQLQKALKELGLYNSTIDGVWGPRTEKALDNFRNWQEAGIASPEILFFGIKEVVTATSINSKSVIEPVIEAESRESKQKYKPQYPIAKNGTSTSRPSNDLGKELLKIGLIGIACSMTPNPGACLEGASGRSPNRLNKSETNIFDPPSFDDSGCTSDFQCSMGQECVKKPYSNRGVCMTSVNRFGAKTFSSPSPSSVKPRFGSKECRFLTDCPIGFQCDMTYKRCVK